MSQLLCVGACVRVLVVAWLLVLYQKIFSVCSSPSRFWFLSLPLRERSGVFISRFVVSFCLSFRNRTCSLKRTWQKKISKWTWSGSLVQTGCCCGFIWARWCCLRPGHLADWRMIIPVLGHLLGCLGRLFFFFLQLMKILLSIFANITSLPSWLGEFVFHWRFRHLTGKHSPRDSLVY